MWKWAPYPFLRITPALITGILIGYYKDLSLPLWTYAGLFIVYLLIVFIPPRRYLVYTRLPAGIVGLLLIGLLGAQLIIEKQDKHHSLHLSKVEEPFQYYLATVSEPPQRRGEIFRTVISAQALIQTDSLHHITNTQKVIGQIMLYQPLEDSLQLPAYGDMLMIRGMPDSVSPPSNPHMFDYRQYLASKNVYLQQYVAAKDWTVYKHQNSQSPAAFAYALREKSTEILLKSLPDISEAAIALALTIGVKDYLDDEISESYAATGAMHVLAVSGLHVGIIYLVLSFLLTPLSYLPFGSWLKAGICIALLWFYALLAGWSPSVLRAAVMFTTIIIAQAWRRQSNIFNTLAVSAFILLCTNPLLIFSVGFQLSYLAVAGIVYLQPKIDRWCYFKHWLPDKIWGLTAVSMAAQLATFPISLYYFHQFPLYFWLSNLFVIPAAFIILSLGLLTIATGLITLSLAQYPGWLLGHIIGLVNKGIASIQHLPMSTWQNISLDTTQMLLVYGCIICLLLLLHYRRLSYLFWMFSCNLLFAGVSFAHFHHQNQQKSITFYQINQQSNIDFTHGTQNYHWGEMNDKTMYNVSPNHLQAGLYTLFIPPTQQEELPLAMHKTANMRISVWHGKKIVFVEAPFEQANVFSNKVKIDVLVISKNAVKDLKAVCANFDFTLLVIDSSNHRTHAQKLADEASELHIACHAVPQQGALVLPIFDLND